MYHEEVPTKTQKQIRRKKSVGNTDSLTVVCNVQCLAMVKGCLSSDTVINSENYVLPRTERLGPKYPPFPLRPQVHQLVS